MREVRAGQLHENPSAAKLSDRSVSGSSLRNSALRTTGRAEIPLSDSENHRLDGIVERQVRTLSIRYCVRRE